MGKGANKNLIANAGQGQQMQTSLASSAKKVSDFLSPELEGDINDPKGYTPQQKAYMNTASQQSLGGSVAGVTGEANLEAARTRNKGGYQGAIASGSRAAQRQLSTNALGVEKANADLQQQQREQAIKSLMALYGIDETTALGYLNTSNSALADENKSHPNQQGLLTAGTFINDIEGGLKQGK